MKVAYCPPKKSQCEYRYGEYAKKKKEYRLLSGLKKRQGSTALNSFIKTSITLADFEPRYYLSWNSLFHSQKSLIFHKKTAMQCILLSTVDTVSFFKKRGARECQRSGQDRKSD